MKESAEEQLRTQGRIIEDMQNTIEALKAPKGIKSANPNKRPEPVPFTTEQKAEQELRRYIKNAGAIVKGLGGETHKVEPGFRKNLPEGDKKRARDLLRILGRVTKVNGKEVFDMKWDEDILNFKTHQPPVRGDDAVV